MHDHADHPGQTRACEPVRADRARGSSLALGGLAESRPELDEEQADLQAQLLDAVGDAVVATDASWRVTCWNAAAERLFGWTGPEARGRSVLELCVSPEEHERAHALAARVLRGEEVRAELELRRRDGGRLPALLTLSPLWDGAGALVGTIGIATDVSDPHRSCPLADRRASQQQAVAELGQRALAGEQPETLLQRIRELLPALLVPEIEVTTAARGAAHGQEPSGWVRAGHWALLAVHTGDGVELDAQDHAFLQALGNALEAAYERRRARQQLEHVASRDPVTGLANRALMVDRLEHVQALAERTGALVGVLFLDLDGFKHINDALGHEVGDRVLRRVADRLRRVVRPGDTVARFGGDEFVIVCPDLPDADAAEVVAQRVHRALQTPLVAGGTELTLTASVGLVAGDHREDASSLLRDAHTAVDAAKERGRNRVALFTPAMRERVRQRVGTADVLRKALDNGGVAVRYQPVFGLASERVEGAEALVRLVLPDGGELAPDRFIWVAEEVGLIHELGEAVLRQACAAATSWVAADPAFVLSVNLSPLQLADDRLVARVQRALADAGLDPVNLSLEITESAVLQTTSGEDQLAQLRGLGIHLALDDFGTGYSALNHLRRLPVDVVKIDRSFVAGMLDEPADRALVAATVDLAHAFGMAVTAEGVEGPIQRDELRGFGCDHAQGYLWSPPVHPGALTHLQRTGVPAADAAQCSGRAQGERSA